MNRTSLCARAALALTLGAAAACGSDDVAGFACVEDADCVRSGSAGACVAGGSCAFTDSSCGTGWRVDSAAASNAGACLYGDGFDNTSWIPESARSAALGHGGDALKALAVPVVNPTPVDAVVVLATRPLVGFDAAGFFVQGTSDSRAWFVTVDPTTLSPAPVPGAVVRFVATETKLDFEQRQINAIAPGSWSVYAGWTESLDDFIVDLPTSGMVDHLTFLNEHESRLVRGRAKLGRGDATHPYSSWSSAGPGHHYISMDVPAFYNAATGLPTAAFQTEFRMPEPLAFRATRELGLREGCTVEFDALPLWRWNAFIEFTVLDLDADMRIVSCDADVPRTPLAIAETMLSDNSDTVEREMWVELVASAPVDLSTCSVYGLDTSTAVPLASSPTMLAAGDRVVLVDSTAPTMPASWQRGSATVTPTYIEIPDLSFTRNELWPDGECGEGILQVACGGTVVDRITGNGCYGYEHIDDPATTAIEPHISMAPPPSVELTLNRSFVAFCNQTTSFTAVGPSGDVAMRGTPGAPNDACF